MLSTIANYVIIASKKATWSTKLVKLITMLPTKPFTKWGINFIGPIKVRCYTCNCYVLVAIDYATKWLEAKTL